MEIHSINFVQILSYFIGIPSSSLINSVKKLVQCKALVMHFRLGGLNLEEEYNKPRFAIQLM